MSEDEYFRREFMTGGLYEDERAENDTDKLRTVFLGAIGITTAFTGSIAAAGIYSGEEKEDYVFPENNTNKSNITEENNLDGKSGQNETKITDKEVEELLED